MLYLVQLRSNNSTEDHSAISSSPHIGPEPASVTTAGIIRSGHLPQPQLGIIGEIERAIKTLARTQNVKERICEYIQQEVSNFVLMVFILHSNRICGMLIYYLHVT
jgi:protein phosphatase-4 regulatory subunit 3